MSEIDLHIHSNCSDDGELMPEEIVYIAKEKKMKAIAITDHNSVRGVKRAIKHGNKVGVEVISGIEIDCTYNGINLHLLGYGIDYRIEEFEKLEKNIIEQEKKAASEKIRKIKEYTDLEISEEEVMAVADHGIVTGELIAEILLNKEENFDREILNPYREGGTRSDMPHVNFYWDFFAQGKAAYVPIDYMTLKESVELIKSSGGVSVIAHPGNNLKGNREIIDDIIKEGVEGIEVFSTYHSTEDTDYFLKKAEEHNLLITCGSDFHGKNKPNIEMGMCDYEFDYNTILELRNKIR